MHKQLHNPISWPRPQRGSSRPTCGGSRLTHAAEQSELDKLLEDLAELIESEGGVLIL